MILKDYLSITGQHGLFRFIAQGRNAMIVEHLETKKRTSAFGSAKVSSLEDISVFTTGEDIPLSKVFDKIYEKENGGPAPDEKSDITVLRSYMEEILPDYDRERVYASDIRKIIMWYNILNKLNLLVKEEPAKEPEKTETEEPEKKEPKPSRGKEKTPGSKTALKKESASGDKNAEGSKTKSNKSKSSTDTK
mgnify:CR=1 FL=1